MNRFIIILFLVTLVCWGYRIIDEYEPRTPMLVCGKHSIDMTAVTGQDDGNGPRFWRYWIHFIKGDDDFELEVDEESWNLTSIGDTWHYRRRRDGTHIFSRK